jgi:16S rRNA processing protein RimM
VQKGLVLIGRITGAHGIRGEVKLQSFTAEPEAIAAYGALRTDRGETVAIERLRPQKQGFIATLKGVSDRNRAEALGGTELFVDRAALPEPRSDENYVHDLVGSAAVTRDGTEFGKVVDVVNYGAGDLLEIARPDDKVSILVPFSDAFVPEIDLAAGRLTLDLPEGYLDER